MVGKSFGFGFWVNLAYSQNCQLEELKFQALSEVHNLTLF